MTNLQRDLYEACDRLFVKLGGTITPADKPRITELVEENMRPWQLDEIIVQLIDGDNPDTPWDESDTVSITVQNGLKVAQVDLRWVDSTGRKWVRVDTDNSGD